VSSIWELTAVGRSSAVCALSFTLLLASVIFVVLTSCPTVAQSLIKDKSFRKYVELYAKDQDKFFEDFAAAYQKLLHLGVPVNNPGQHAPA